MISRFSAEIPRKNPPSSMLTPCGMAIRNEARLSFTTAFARARTDRSTGDTAASALYFAGHQSLFVMMLFIVALPPLYYVAIGLWRQNTPLTVAGVGFLAIHFIHVWGNLR